MEEEEKDSRENEASNIDYNTGESSNEIDTDQSYLTLTDENSSFAESIDTGEYTSESDIDKVIRRQDAEEAVNQVYEFTNFSTASNEENKSKSGLNKPSEKTPEKEKPTRRNSI